MSLIVSKSVWANSKQSGTGLLMLLALAESANDYGEAHPGVAYLADKCRMKLRNAQLLLRQLQEAGEIDIVNQGGEPTATGRTNLYIVRTPGVLVRQGVQSSAPLREQGVQSTVARGAKSGSEGVQSSTPKPYNETVLTQRNGGVHAQESTPPPRKDVSQPIDKSHYPEIRHRLTVLGVRPADITHWLRLRPGAIIDDVEACEEWVRLNGRPIGTLDRPCSILWRDFLKAGDVPPRAYRANGRMNGHGPSRSPPQPDLYEAQDPETGEYYIATADGKRYEG